jgi:type II secretory pathway predicted ATPase ExeA
MYQSFFGLKDNPFTPPPDSRYLYLSPSHRDSLEKLVHGIDEKGELLVLTAAPGMGKTMLLHTLLEHLEPKVHTAVIFFARLDFQDFLQYLLEDFGIETTVSTAAQYLTQLHRWLIDHHTKDGTALIFIDEAQNLPLDLLANLSKLLDLECAGDKLVQIILAGQPALHETLRHPTLQQLRHRIAVTCALEPLSAAETQAYIQHRFAVAGGDAQAVFSPQAFKTLYTFTGGIPRLLQTLCDNTLLASYTTGQRQVSPQTIRETAQELGLHPPQKRAGPQRRTTVVALVCLVVLGITLYVVPRALRAPLAWSQVQAVVQQGYHVVTTHTRNAVPRVVNFVRNLGGQGTSASDASTRAEQAPVDTTTTSVGPSGFFEADVPERHVEQEEIQAIVQP